MGRHHRGNTEKGRIGPSTKPNRSGRPKRQSKAKSIVARSAAWK